MGYTTSPPIGSTVPHQPAASVPPQPATMPGSVSLSQEQAIRSASATRVAPAAVTVVRSMGPVQTPFTSSLGSVPTPEIPLPMIPNITLPTFPTVPGISTTSLGTVCCVCQCE